MTKQRRFLIRLFVGIGLMGLIAISAGVWFLYGNSIRERLNRREFDTVTWKADTHSFTNAVRIRMVDDLLHRYSFRGMTREQITAIVGEPDKTEYFKDWDLVYWLGPERSWVSIDSEWLVFRVDNEKKISDFRIVTD